MLHLLLGPDGRARSILKSAGTIIPDKHRGNIMGGRSHRRASRHRRNETMNHNGIYTRKENRTHIRNKDKRKYAFTEKTHHNTGHNEQTNTEKKEAPKKQETQDTLTLRTKTKITYQRRRFGRTYKRVGSARNPVPTFSDIAG